ncbi:MAG: metalloregulator ArsR/SmtB family transcription factor [bacterium]
MLMKHRETEKYLKAVANHRRLTIIDFLKKNHEATVGDIACAIGLSFAATSRHLNILARLDIVIFDQRGVLVYYSVHPKQRPIIRHVIDSI